jgi:hypothetical protein
MGMLADAGISFSPKDAADLRAELSDFLPWADWVQEAMRQHYATITTYTSTGIQRGVPTDYTVYNAVECESDFNILSKLYNYSGGYYVTLDTSRKERDVKSV